MNMFAVRDMWESLHTQYLFSGTIVKIEKSDECSCLQMCVWLLSDEIKFP